MAFLNEPAERCKHYPTCEDCQVCYPARIEYRASRQILVDPDFGGYMILRNGINGMNNYWEKREFLVNAFPNKNVYHYHNHDGTRFWHNPDWSTLMIDAHGGEHYGISPERPETPPATREPQPNIIAHQYHLPAAIAMPVHVEHVNFQPHEDKYSVKKEEDEWEDALRREVFADRAFLAERFEGLLTPKTEEEEYHNYIKQEALY